MAVVIQGMPHTEISALVLTAVRSGGISTGRNGSILGPMGRQTLAHAALK